MKRGTQTTSKPISLAGCMQIFKKAGISELEYSIWGIGQIFEKAEEIARKQELTCEEITIDPFG